MSTIIIKSVRYNSLSAGFLLFEMLIALAILATALSLGALYHWRVIHDLHTVRQQTQALSYARQALDVYKRDGKNGGNSYVKDGYTISYAVEPYTVHQELRLPDGACQLSRAVSMVSASVVWFDMNRVEHKISLSSLAIASS
ncbi:MAG TPA: type II secretion system protein [Gammaproteobacteria bacterium]|nr:type II secretion system protein [Gammaproteobacteria bacterium]